MVLPYITAVGIKRRNHYSWKKFFGRIAILKAKSLVEWNTDDYIVVQIQDGDATSTSGDSGAPLMQGHGAIGVLCGYRSKDVDDKPITEYTDIEKHENWIKRNSGVEFQES